MIGWGDDDTGPSSEAVAAGARHQARVALRFLRIALARGRTVEVDVALIRALHRSAMQGIDHAAGELRTRELLPLSSLHEPPPAAEVPALMATFVSELDALSAEGAQASEQAAFAMCRMLWIHPFHDGNGRTARTLSYVVLCSSLGLLVPGKYPIPLRIERTRKEYFDALQAADKAFARGTVDVTLLASLIRRHLRAQIRDEPLPERTWF